MRSTSASRRYRSPPTSQKSRARRKTSARRSPPLPIPEELLHATTQPDIVTVPARNVLAYEGRGAPESDAFQNAFPALYGIAYALKFARKHSRGIEFKIGPLESRWWAAAPETVLPDAPRDTWCWRLRIAVPDDVTEEEVEATIRATTSKKGGKLEKSAEARRVVLERIPEQRVGRALHIGSYADEGRTFQTIAQTLERERLKPTFAHVEIYLNDPRRTAPPRLKTVLLYETL